MTFEMKTSWR